MTVLSNLQINRFHSQGYLVLDSYWIDFVEDLRRECSCIVNESLKRDGINVNSDE